MSALGMASLGTQCEDRALGMSSLGVFCTAVERRGHGAGKHVKKPRRREFELNGMSIVFDANEPNKFTIEQLPGYEPPADVPETLQEAADARDRLKGRLGRVRTNQPIDKAILDELQLSEEELMVLLLLAED